MIRAKLREIDGFVRLEKKEQKDLERAVVRYLLGINSTSVLNRSAKKYGIKSGIENLRSSYLSKSEYAVSMFWRAVHAWASGAPAAELKRAFDITDDDLEMISESLIGQDIVETLVHLRERKKEKIDEKLVNKLLKSVKPLCTSLAYKMRFIYNYDAGLSLEDFRSEFMLEALRVIRHYDYTEDEAHLKNRVIRSVYNYWKRLIEFYTAKRRRRLTQSDDDSREYVQKVFSLDYFLEMDNEAGQTTLHSIIGENIISQEEIAVGEEFVERLTEEIPPEICMYVDIVHGQEFSYEFISWMAETKGKHPSELNENKLRKCAIKYLAIDKEELKKLGMLIDSMGEIDGNDRNDQRGFG